MRYRATTEQLEHSCCYAACVIDTTLPVMIGGQHWRNKYTLVCECFDLATAERIASALNATENLQ